MRRSPSQSSCLAKKFPPSYMSSLTAPSFRLHTRKQRFVLDVFGSTNWNSQICINPSFVRMHQWLWVTDWEAQRPRLPTALLKSVLPAALLPKWMAAWTNPHTIYEEGTKKRSNVDDLCGWDEAEVMVPLFGLPSDASVCGSGNQRVVKMPS